MVLRSLNPEVCGNSSHCECFLSCIGESLMELVGAEPRNYRDFAQEVRILLYASIEEEEKRQVDSPRLIIE